MKYISHHWALIFRYNAAVKTALSTSHNQSHSVFGWQIWVVWTDGPYMYSQSLHSLLWYEAPVFIQTLLQSLSLLLWVVGEEILLTSDWDFMTPGPSCKQLSWTRIKRKHAASHNVSSTGWRQINSEALMNCLNATSCLENAIRIIVLYIKMMLLLIDMKAACAA